MSSFYRDFNYSDFHQRRIQLFSNNSMRVEYDQLVRVVLNIVVDPGEGLGTRPTPLFLDQNEAKGPKKIFLRRGSPSYLKAWIHH